MVTCDYCGQPAPLVTGADVYPGLPALARRRFYKCDPCHAWVGCHPGTIKPLGRLANAPLRRARVKAHDRFDRLWRGGRMKRTDAYAWLAEQLGIKPEDCHIGMFDAAACARVVEVCG